MAEQFMKLAIMQPYLFPYIGYFQLIKAVDQFVIYDDVTFIKQGWINRNRILSNGKACFFTIPLSGAGSHTIIHDVVINTNLFTNWRCKFLKTLEQSYSKATYHQNILALINEILSYKTSNISELALFAINTVCDYLSIKTNPIKSSTIYHNNELHSVERIIDICIKERATTYVNAPGGTALYTYDQFISHGIDLYFLKPHEIIYQQYSSPFIPKLSIIDVLMFNSVERIKTFLNAFTLE